MSIKKQFISSTKWNAISTLLTAILGLIQLWLLSHILDIEDFGIISAAMVFISIIAVFTNFGIGNTIIRTPNISNIEISSIFIFGLALGIAAWAAIYFGSNYISVQLHSSKLEDQLKIASFSLIFLSLSQCHKSMLIKELRFRELSLANLLCTLLSFLISVGYAYLYNSPIGVAVGFTVSNVFLCIIYYLRAKELIKMSLSFSFASIKKHLSLCIQSFADSIINAVNLNVAPLIVGKIIGIKYLGGYNIANTLTGFPSARLLPVLYQVLFPSLSRMQDDLCKLKKAFIDVSSIIFFVMTPAFLGLFIISDSFIKLCFDEKWYFIIPLVKILSLTYYFRCICGPYMSMLILKGKIYLSTLSNVLSLILFTSFSYIGGKYYGANGVAVGFLLSQIIIFLFILYAIVSKCLGIKLSSYLTCIIIPLIHSIPMGLMAFLSVLLFNSFNQLVQFTIIIVICSITYGMTILFSKNDKALKFKKTCFDLIGINVN